MRSSLPIDVWATVKELQYIDPKAFGRKPVAIGKMLRSWCRHRGKVAGALALPNGLLAFQIADSVDGLADIETLRRLHKKPTRVKMVRGGRKPTRRAFNEVDAYQQSWDAKRALPTDWLSLSALLPKHLGTLRGDEIRRRMLELDGRNKTHGG